MERISRLRSMILLLIFSCVLMLYAGRLYFLQIIDTKGNTDNTATYTTLTTVRASRAIFWIATATSWWATAPAITWCSTTMLSNQRTTVISTSTTC